MGLLHLGYSVLFSVWALTSAYPSPEGCSLGGSMEPGGSSVYGSSSRSTYVSTIKCFLLC